MIGICTDSSSHLPSFLAERYGIEVVPQTVTVDEVEHLENVDLDADAFYASFADGRCPTVGTTQPSPGQFVVAYEDLIARGCTEILSIHLASSVSGTINAARLAAHSMGLPVRLVDSGTAGFGISCCVLAAATAIANGASLDEAAAIAERVGPSVGNVFVASSLDHVLGAERAADFAADEMPVLSLRAGNVEVVRRVSTALDAVNEMARYAIGWGQRLRVAIGHSCPGSLPFADALADAVGEAASVTEVIRYRVGPSIGALTGPGTASCFVFPV